MSEKPINHLIEELNIAGEVPDPALIQAILQRREEAEPVLLAIFKQYFEDDGEISDDLSGEFIVHAGKLMIAWQNEAALPTFAQLYGSTDWRLDFCEQFEEDLVYFGPAVIPYLKPVFDLDTKGEWSYGKGLSAAILTRIATYYPDQRAEIMALFRSLLPPPDNIPDQIDEMWGEYAANLGDLADEESRTQVLALADADVLFEDFFRKGNYLRAIQKGFTPQKPPTFDLLKGYRDTHRLHQRWLSSLARESKKREAQIGREVGVRQTPKVGRNDPCPCGSGKKYKKCHGRPV